MRRDGFDGARFIFKRYLWCAHGRGVLTPLQFLVLFHQAILENDLPAITNMYESGWNKLTQVGGNIDEHRECCVSPTNFLRLTTSRPSGPRLS